MNTNRLKLKNVVLIAICIVTMYPNLSFAQETRKFRGGLETGFSYYEEFMPVPYTNTHFAPFVGAGLGYYFARGHEDHTETHFKFNNPTVFIRTDLKFGRSEQLSLII